jgi:hypothetical protein
MKSCPALSPGPVLSPSPGPCPSPGPGGVMASQDQDPKPVTVLRYRTSSEGTPRASSLPQHLAEAHLDLRP